MPLSRELRGILVGSAVILVGLLLVVAGYGLLPPQDAGWPAVGAGLLAIVGLVAVLVGIFFFIVPSVLPRQVR